MMLMCLPLTISIRKRGHQYNKCSWGSHEWQATVSTPADLGLVYVDENSWMSQWPSTTVTGHNPRLCPSHGLLVNEVDGCFWLGLRDFHTSQPVPQPGAPVELLLIHAQNLPDTP